ncbi:MAG TPA: hypothetical protein VHA71_12765 [Rhodanobacteraceae bacterium]|nr:hypothetical protein [Rhodanobacteraceae bacterium]
MGVDTEERAEDASARNSGAETAPAFGAVFTAGADLVQALRRVATALAALLASEVRVLRASAAVVFLGSVALVAFSVSLWACAVALIGWAFVKATGSVGIALGLLVVLHLILVTTLWLAIKRAIRHASFPATRIELRALRDELRGHVERFQHASASSEREKTP